MEELVKLITDNGIGVGCVVFMIYFINTTLKNNNNILNEIQKTLVLIQTNLTLLTQRVDKVEEKIKSKE